MFFINKMLKHSEILVVYKEVTGRNSRLGQSKLKHETVPLRE